SLAQRLISLLPTPRATNRFSNIFPILKAPVRLARLSAFEGTPAAPGTFQVPMLLLALLIGAPREAAIIFPALLDRVRAGRDPIAELNALRALGFGEDLAAASQSKIDTLQPKLSAILTGDSFPRAAEPYRYWIPRVARFSFEVGRGIRLPAGQGASA